LIATNGSFRVRAYNLTLCTDWTAWCNISVN
jgi:hypothetical protein